MTVTIHISPFIDDLSENPTDWDTMLIFADYLEEYPIQNFIHPSLPRVLRWCYAHKKAPLLNPDYMVGPPGRFWWIGRWWNGYDCPAFLHPAFWETGGKPMEGLQFPTDKSQYFQVSDSFYHRSVSDSPGQIASGLIGGLGISSGGTWTASPPPRLASGMIPGSIPNNASGLPPQREYRSGSFEVTPSDPPVNGLTFVTWEEAMLFLCQRFQVLYDYLHPTITQHPPPES